MYNCVYVCTCVQFLGEKSYGKAFTTKQLHQPSTKEFLHIFNVRLSRHMSPESGTYTHSPLLLLLLLSHCVQFLAMMVDPAMEVNGMNIVEDVPKTLKLLG